MVWVHSVFFLVRMVYYSIFPVSQDFLISPISLKHCIKRNIKMLLCRKFQYIVLQFCHRIKTFVVDAVHVMSQQVEYGISQVIWCRQYCSHGYVPSRHVTLLNDVNNKKNSSFTASSDDETNKSNCFNQPLLNFVFCQWLNMATCFIFKMTVFNFFQHYRTTVKNKIHYQLLKKS